MNGSQTIEEPAEPKNSVENIGKACNKGSDEVQTLIIIYYFGDNNESLHDYSTITLFASATDLDLSIYQIKQAIAFFLRTCSSSTDARSSAVEITPVSVGDGAVSSVCPDGPSIDGAPSSLAQLPLGISQHMIDSMIAVLGSESHIQELLDNIDRIHIVQGREPGDMNILENWCLQENTVFRKYFNHPVSPTSQSSIHFILAAGNMMPVPVPRVRIVSTSKSSDIYQRLFTTYHMIVKQAGLEWTISHRYSDFVDIHTRLLTQNHTDMGYIPQSKVPDIPGKEILKSSSIDDVVVKKRSVGLQKFIDDLLEIPSALSNHHGSYYYIFYLLNNFLTQVFSFVIFWHFKHGKACS